MLNNTMGSNGDFDRRRQELVLIKQKLAAADPSADVGDEVVTDDEVVASYVTSVQPGESESKRPLP